MPRRCEATPQQAGFDRYFRSPFPLPLGAPRRGAKSEPATDRSALVLFGLLNCLLASDASFLLVAIPTLRNRGRILWYGPDGAHHIEQLAESQHEIEQ
jgi:hypothetical protein